MVKIRAISPAFIYFRCFSTLSCVSVFPVPQLYFILGTFCRHWLGFTPLSEVKNGNILMSRVVCDVAIISFPLYSWREKIPYLGGRDFFLDADLKVTNLLD